MIVYNNQAPDAVNNVGQFGATEGSIGAYKQAAEYAADSKYWALLAESKFGTIDDLIAEVERLYQQGVLMKQDIEDLKQDFIDQDARLMTLIAQTNAAVSDANNAVALINQKLIEVQRQLDILLGMSVDVTTLPPGSQATGSFNPNTGVISLGIPEGEPGKDGSVTDLNTVDTGIPELGDLGFYVDKDDNTVHKTTLENIANLIPSVRSVSINGGPALDGEVDLTINKGTVGLGNVLNVAQYSRQEINDKFDKTTKTYQSKAEADADAQYRQVGEKVLVWEATKYEFYTVAADKTLTPVKTEGRILTVNSRSPDSSGNIDITIPTGNPSLYLGEMVMFPYDPTKDISYPGVLPADGRLVSKESALDLGPSLISGQLPVVSETEWQAGAKQYFSWGKLADGVTDADSTNFINIRLPDWTGGEAIRAPDSDRDSQYNGTVQAQKPYVVTVNNQAPDEITGNVNLSRSILGAASSGANSDITSLSGLTTPLSISQGGTGSTTVDGVRDALKITPFTSEYSHAFIYSPNLLNRIVLMDEGLFIIQERSDTSSDWVSNPISIASGGTGATTVEAARTNLGLGSSSTYDVGLSSGQVMQVGAFGLGTNVDVSTGGNQLNVGNPTSNITRFSNVPPSVAMGFLPNQWRAGFEIKSSGATGLQFWASSFGTTPRAAIRIADSDSNGYTDFAEFYTTVNTTKASDGTLKVASPVVKIFSDGSFHLNDESAGCTVTRINTGAYLIEGCMGLNADAAWGGIDGGFDIPTDRNKQPLIWLDYEVNADGSILVRTYHRTYPTAPVFARNERDGIEDGEPVDIPADQFVSVRVEMPSE